MIHVFMKHISSFQANIDTLTKQVLAPCFHENHYKSKKFFHQYHTAYQSKLLYPWKFEVRLIETTQNDWCEVVPFCPFAKDSEPKNGIKMQQQLLFGFLLFLVIYLSKFDSFNKSCSAEISMMIGLDIFCYGPS